MEAEVMKAEAMETGLIGIEITGREDIPRGDSRYGVRSS